MKKALVLLAAFVVAAVFVWQALAAHGNPDPATPGLSPAAMILSSGVLVFREGLEAILVLAAVTAGMSRTNRKDYLRAIPIGAALAFLASIATWFLVVALISHINAPALQVQAATGLVAIVVLLVIMNWFFHKVYWTGWIANHSNRRKRILEAADKDGSGTFIGLALLGFTAIYREGFEIVLFLQNLRLQAGATLVLQGTVVGLTLTAMVAALTFVAHKRLPYKKMLIATGVLLGFVLLVMVGEEAQEMQLAGWLHTTTLHLPIPDWMGLWFSVFPTTETLIAQAIAAILVIGSYVAANSRRKFDLTRKQDDAFSEPSQGRTHKITAGAGKHGSVRTTGVKSGDGVMGAKPGPRRTTDMGGATSVKPASGSGKSR